MQELITKLIFFMQLIFECKEVIRSSVHMKQYYQSMTTAVMPDDPKAQEHAESDIEEFENDLQEMLRVNKSDSIS